MKSYRTTTAVICAVVVLCFVGVAIRNPAPFVLAAVLAAALVLAAHAGEDHLDWSDEYGESYESLLERAERLRKEGKR